MRKSGILMHLSSLPSPYGIGTMGQNAREFVDFLKASGQKYWQLLPICPTSYGDSPYQSYSTFAGNPYFIDLDELEKQGLLEKTDYQNIDWESAADRVNYGAMYQKRYPLLHKAADKFLECPPKEFEEFCLKNAFWLDDFSLFMALKDAHHGAPWSEWPMVLRNREVDALRAATQIYRNSINFWKVLQYLFFEQWKELKAYAHANDISIIGDLPIYVSLDSVDVWAHPELFQLDENKIPKEVAGCPPDGFSADGQLWGNPLFNWEYMEKTDYAWWIQRIEYLCKVYDVLRIDHFRAFDGYYAIPYGDETAKNGSWKPGPGMKLFDAVERTIGRQSIIAEDLGHLTDSVRTLLRDSGFPGMKVLQFAFDRRDDNSQEYLFERFVTHCVAYTGTHDNTTIVGWFEEANPDDVAYAREYLHIPEGAEVNWSMMDAIWNSIAELAIVTSQDLLGLGSEARMNEPATVGKNWQWRALPGVFTPELAEKIRQRMKKFGRL